MPLKADDPISSFYLFIKSKLLVYRNGSLPQGESPLCVKNAHFAPIHYLLYT